MVPDTYARAKAAHCPGAVQVSLAAQRQPCAVHRVHRSSKVVAVSD